MVGVSASMLGMGPRLHATPRTSSPFLTTATPTLRRRTFQVAASGSGGGPPVLERAISVAAYALPFVNSVRFGRHLFALYPAATALVRDPLISLYQSTPRYAIFIGFIGLYVAVERNTAFFSRFARFNASQAILLDAIFVSSALLARALLSPRFSVWAHSGVFVLNSLCCLYAIVNCVIGRTPYLPLLSDVTSRQL